MPKNSFLRFMCAVKGAEEGMEAFVFAGAEDFIGCTLLRNDAVIHKNDLIGNVLGKIHFVGNDDHGHILGGKLLDDLQDLARDFGVERRSRLIKAKHVGIQSERTRDGNTLLLTARKLTGIGIGFIGKSDLGKQFLCLLHRLCDHGFTFRLAFFILLTFILDVLNGRERDIFKRRISIVISRNFSKRKYLMQKFIAFGKRLIRH